MNDDWPVASSKDALWLLQLRQRESWQKGENVSVEMLASASEGGVLAEEVLLELILSEFALREEFGHQLSTDDYVRRFPNLKQRLERLFAMRAAMDNTVSGYTSDQQTDSESPLREASPTAPVEGSPGTVEPIESRMLGSYRLLEKIGEGGMGTVYKALHNKLKKVVSIKLLPQHLTSDAALTARFQREMESVGALDHPHIVRAMDAGEVDGTHFLVMEFVDGEDLAKVVKARGQLSVEEACTVIEQAADALQHAHDHGLVHRDIKPSNLMWTRDKKVKVLDLGLARCQLESQLAAASELTESGQAVGTIDYMSPEQARDSKAVDGRADIYSLGCTLYFLLTGQPLYAGRGRVEKLFAHRDEPAPSLVAKRGDIPIELNRVFQRMVAKRPEDRYASMAEVRGALDAVRFNGSAEHPPQTTATSNGPYSGAHPARALLSPSFGDGDSATDRTAIGTLAASTSGPLRTRLWVAAFGSLTALLAAVVFTLKTPHGIVIVEINEPDARVEVVSDKNQIEVTRQSDSKPLKISLDPGKHRMKVSKDGFELYTEEFTIESKGTKTISAKLVPISVTKSGWHSWPADAPPPAIAPFDATQAKHHQEAWANYLGVPVEYTNGIGMKFRLIPPGEFMMGSTEEEVAEALVAVGEHEDMKEWRTAIQSETPRQRVVVDAPFYLGDSEVTQKEFLTVTGRNPAQITPEGKYKDRLPGGDSLQQPVESVSWIDAVNFCSQLSDREQLKRESTMSGAYQLPTELQWEFSCRAGTTSQFSSGNDSKNLSKVAWFWDSSGNCIHPVRKLDSNPFGIFDMHGNVEEWVFDTWTPNSYRTTHSSEIPDDSQQIAGLPKVIRGGHWFGNATTCRSANRFFGNPKRVHLNLGFRVSLSIDAVRQNLKVSGPALPNPISPLSQDRKVAQIAVRLHGEVAFVSAKGDQTARQLSELPSGPFTVKALQLAQSLVTDDDLKPIGELKDLQELILGECSQVTDAGLKNLGNLSSLSTLNLLGTQVTDDGVAYLVNLPMLRRLNLRRSQVTRHSLNSILHHRHLQELGLGKVNVNDDDIVKLLPLEKITDLDLQGTEVTDRVVDVLIQFPKLRSVSLGETAITDEGMKKLLAAPHIRRQLWRLDLHRNRNVTDDMCRVLTECTALEGVWLEGTRITDDGLQSLAKVPSLKEVWLQETRVSTAGIMNFKKEHPNCVVGEPIAESR